MALLKEIEQPNGIKTTYHRIISLDIITNHLNLIKVASYTSPEKRQEEINAIQNKTEYNIYTDMLYKITDYNQNMTISMAYDYLKTLPEFKDSEDV